MAGHGQKWLEWLDMAGSTQKLQEMARNCRNGWMWLEMAGTAGHGLKLDGLMTVLEIWGVWNKIIRGFGDL